MFDETLEFGRGNDIFRSFWQNLFDLFPKRLHPLRELWERAQELRQWLAGIRLPNCLNSTEKTVRVVAGLVNVLNSEVVRRELKVALKFQRSEKRGITAYRNG